MAADESTDTVISVTNLDNAACATVVEWKIGHGTASCMTSANLDGGSPVGDTQDHCLRRTNGLPVGCNAWCPIEGIRIEGAAIVRAEPSCKGRIAVDARLYYFDNDIVSGVADLKVVKLPSGNRGE